jgi:hypothetical protein
MSQVVVRIDRERARGQLVGADAIGLGVSRFHVARLHQKPQRQNHQRADIVVVDLQGLLAKAIS